MQSLIFVETNLQDVEISKIASCSWPSFFEYLTTKITFVLRTFQSFELLTKIFHLFLQKILKQDLMCVTVKNKSLKIKSQKWIKK